MVERRQLTPEFVHRVTPPTRGECWFADTKIRGFGLRLWATRSGGNKAFAIRTVASDGKLVRKTFDVNKSWRTNIGFAYSGRKNLHGLGDYLEDAREWARDEIDNEKARLTISEEHWIDHEIVGEHVQKMPLSVAAQSLLVGMGKNGRSQRYIDRLDKLFANNVSAKLKKTPLQRVSAKDIAKCLVKKKVPAGNIRILRSFIGQIFQRAADFHGPFLRFRHDISAEFQKRWKDSYDVRYPELRKLNAKQYEAIFARLESERVFWQAALCIRLFFIFHSPLIKVLSGRWEQIDGEHWYPYWPDEKTFWYECRERIENKTRILLDKIKERGRREFGAVSYWFPNRSTSFHITSVDLMWRKVLADCHMQYYPLREFARSYRNPNCPSYYISFLRQYGEHFRELDNVAELSKIRMAMKKSERKQ